MAKILFVTTRIPYPPWEGHQIRTYNLLKRVCDVHEVKLVSFVRSDEDPVHADHLRTICKSVDLIKIPADQSRLKIIDYDSCWRCYENTFRSQKIFGTRNGAKTTASNCTIFSRSDPF